MEEVLFFAAAIGALGGAVGVVAMRNPFYSVLALIVHLFSLAVLFLLLSSAFLAAAQVVVYAGAVMVLYVFVVAYVGGEGESAWEPIPGQQLLAPLLGIALFVELAIAVLASSLLALGTDGPKVSPGFGDPAAIGTLLLEKFLIPFEAASILLLLAAVGAVVLAGRQQALGPEERGGPSVGGFAPEHGPYEGASVPSEGPARALAREGAGVSSERFAREERDPRGDSSRTQNRRVASEEDASAPSAGGAPA